MPPRSAHAATGSDNGNFVAEWFGHRIYPTVTASDTALQDQQASRCPFLTSAVGEPRPCVKAANSLGICTISSVSNRRRQDWLVCPFRALDQSLVKELARRLFAVAPERPVTVIPAPTLLRADVREAFADRVTAGEPGFLYLQAKLGGEISVAPTERSPELSFDFTMVEVLPDGPRCRIGRYGILEVQTMDYHGTYKAAVTNLKDALRLHRGQFHAALRENQPWLSQGIEGPNIANVFKRTFYQIVLKFQIGEDGACAGSVLAIPASVWDSWQRHLGKPDLAPRPDGTAALRIPGEPELDHVSAWICVFDIDAASGVTPNPLLIHHVIATDADAVAHYALKVAPHEAVVGSGGVDGVLASIRRRLAAWWPDLT